MAELGLVDITVFKDKSAGNTSQVPASGITVKVFPEGMWVDGSGTIALNATDSVTVHDVPGDVAVDDLLFVFDSTTASGLSSGVLKVTATTATTVTGKALIAAFTWTATSRLIRFINTTLYSDDQGADAKSAVSTLTTDSAGYAFGYVDRDDVDLVISGTGITPSLKADYHTGRPSGSKFNIIDSATAVAFTVDTTDTLSTSGAKLLSLKNAGTEEFYVTFAGDVWTDSGVFVSDVASGGDAFVLDADNAFSAGNLLSLTNNSLEKFAVDYQGGFTAAQASTITAGGLTISGGGVTITGNSTITGTLGGLTGLTVVSGGATITAGGILNDVGTITSSVADGASAVGTELDTDEAYSTDGARLLSVRNNNTERFAIDHGGRVIAKGSSLVTGDVALSAGWGDAASVSGVAGTDVAGQIQITSSGTGQGANPTATLTFTDGSLPGAESCICIVTRRSGAQPTVGFQAAGTNNGVVFTFDGTPSAAEVFEFNFFTIGNEA